MQHVETQPEIVLHDYASRQLCTLGHSTLPTKEVTFWALGCVILHLKSRGSIDATSLSNLFDHPCDKCPRGGGSSVKVAAGERERSLSE